MIDFNKPQKDIKGILANGGVWTKVLGFTKVDGQPGIWLDIPNGDSVYYNPSSEAMQSYAFTACSDLENHQVLVLLPSDAPASGLIVNSGKRI